MIHPKKHDGGKPGLRKMRTNWTIKMKLSVLLLLSALLTLGSAAPKDLEKKNQTEEVINLNPDLENVVPEHTANGSLLAVLTPLDSEEEKLAQPLSYGFQGSTLRWQTSYGSVPSGAVGIYNSYTKRYDYVCKYGCSAGFFNRGLGPRCRYSYAGRERLGYPFQMLVNKDNFEILEWKGESWGRVPQHSVKTCLWSDLYVGRNRYGLGKVHASHKSFYLPWEGKEYSYRDYQVLTINRNFYHERMFNVKYDSNVKVTEHPPETMRQSTIVNNECRPVEKMITLSETTQEDKRWDTSTATTVGVTTSITAQIPFFGSFGVSFGVETTEQFSSGTTISKSTTHSVTVTQTVPPNHSCRVSMVGRKYEAEIPFTASLRRSYHDGTTRVASISGTFRGVDVGGIHSLVDRCTPLPTASPCP